MDHLSKHQLILVSLLISFVTSLATGIVTVSLMDQAPKGVTSTISQVIQRTVQQVLPANVADSTATPTPPAPTVSDAVEAISSSIVRLKDANSSRTIGLGLIVSKAGVIATDKVTIAQLSQYQGVMSDGTLVPLTVVQSQNDGDLVFLAPSVVLNPPIKFTPVTFGNAATLGQNVYSLTGTTTLKLSQGLVTDAGVSTAANVPASTIVSSIPTSSVMSGSPLFDIDGELLGMRTSSLSSDNGTAFFPASQLKAFVPVIK